MLIREVRHANFGISSSPFPPLHVLPQVGGWRRISVIRQVIFALHAVGTCMACLLARCTAGSLQQTHQSGPKALTSTASSGCSACAWPRLCGGVQPRNLLATISLPNGRAGSRSFKSCCKHVHLRSGARLHIKRLIQKRKSESRVMAWAVVGSCWHLRSYGASTQVPPPHQQHAPMKKPSLLNTCSVPRLCFWLPSCRLPHQPAAYAPPAQQPGRVRSGVGWANNALPAQHQQHSRG